MSIKDFSYSLKKSISTITLFVKDNLKKYSNLLKKIDGKYFIHKSVMKIFNSINRFDLLYKLNKSKDRVLKSGDNISVKDNIKSVVGDEWDLFCHVNYSSTLSKELCEDQFYWLEKYIKSKGLKDITIFYTNEPNNVRNTGYHTHFVLKLKDKAKTHSVKKLIDDFFRRNDFAITVIKKYIRELDGLSYILKHINSYHDSFSLINF